MEEDQDTSGTASVWDAATKEQLQHQKQQQQKEQEQEENSMERDVSRKDEYANAKNVNNIETKPFWNMVICMHAHTHTCARTHMHAHTHARTHTHTCAHFYMARY